MAEVSAGERSGYARAQDRSSVAYAGNGVEFAAPRDTQTQLGWVVCGWVGRRDQWSGGIARGRVEGWAGFGCGGPRPWTVESMLAALPKPLLRPRQSAERV